MYVLVFVSLISANEVAAFTAGVFDSYESCMVELHEAEIAVKENDTVACLMVI
jgi:adenine-specific DNA methylase